MLELFNNVMVPLSAVSFVAMLGWAIYYITH